MRDLILKMSMSLDGFVSDIDGTNGWMFGTTTRRRPGRSIISGARGST